MVRIDLSDEALAAGCSNTPAGVHTGKTMMLAEVRALFAAVPAGAARSEYQHEALEANGLSKASAAGRLYTYKILRRLYGLDPAVPLFAVLRRLWPVEVAAQPTLAMLCAAARDPLLRATAAYVVELGAGAELSRETLRSEVAGAYPGRHSPSVLEHLAQNMASTWTQAGLVKGSRVKTRVRPPLTVPGFVYALYLGHIDGESGPALLTSLWARLLDAPEAVLGARLAEAARAGWIDLAASGGMTEISFSHLDTLVSTAVR